MRSRQRGGLSSAGVLTMGLVLSAGGAIAQPQQAIVGSWTLVSFTVEGGEKAMEPLNKAAVLNNMALFGTYAFGNDERTMIFRIEGSSFPNWEGAEQLRGVSISGDALTLTNVTPSAGGGTARVVWRRSYSTRDTVVPQPPSSVPRP
jgi:hypothetical protein